MICASLFTFLLTILARLLFGTKAGEFAKRINAKKLVLNHFSARYKGDQSIDSMTIMTRIERQAIKASGLPEDSVAAAWDFMVLPVAR